MEDELQKRKENILNSLKNNKNYIFYIILAIIIYIGFHIRTRNLNILKDVTTGKYIPVALDPHLYLRYSKYILENGKLFSIDPFRYVPLGADMSKESGLLSYFIVYLHKFLSFFNSNITIELTDILYPAIAYIIMAIFFFLLIRRLFNEKIALLSTAFLTVIPTFLYRSMTGFSDKEALGITLMFISLYLYVSSWQSKTNKNAIILSLLSGISTGLMGLVWGGVNFLLFIIGTFTLIEIFLNKFTKKDLYIYSSWFIPTVFILAFLTSRFGGLLGFAQGFTAITTILAFFVALIYIYLPESKIPKLKEKIPRGVLSFIMAFVLLIISSFIILGPKFIIFKIQHTINLLLNPFGQSRWALTVAESHQPFISGWIGQLGWVYFLLFMLGSILLFYEMISPIKDKKYHLTSLYTLFIFSFVFSRYSPASILNGTSTLSKFLYIGSFIIFIIILVILYLNSFYKNKIRFHQILSLNKKYLFIFIWFLVMIIAARSAERLLFIFSPITTILAAYLVVEIATKSIKLKDRLYKVAIIIALLVILLAPSIHGSLTNFTKISYNSAKFTGPSYNQQWQTAMKWVRENTPKDAVFAHWWDYGYWVQTGGERATITDGGNWIGLWNHFMGRLVLTAQNETEPLAFLKTHKADYLLMINDEIGKYPAYSSIGADEKYDRYSWITTFFLDSQRTQETRNQTLLFYAGGHALDDDFVFNNYLFPRGSAGIGAIVIPVDQQDPTKFSQPTALIIHNNQQFPVPLECIFFNNQEMNFPVKGLAGCFRIIPVINGNQVNDIGAGLYLSEDTRKSLFTQLFLFNKDSEYFKLVYDDSQRMPLAIVNNVGLIGPLKIWEITYPKDLKEDPYYLLKTYEEANLVNVTKV